VTPQFGVDPRRVQRGATTSCMRAERLSLADAAESPDPLREIDRPRGHLLRGLRWCAVRWRRRRALPVILRGQGHRQSGLVDARHRRRPGAASSDRSHKIARAEPRSLLARATHAPSRASATRSNSPVPPDPRRGRAGGACSRNGSWTPRCWTAFPPTAPRSPAWPAHRLHHLLCRALTPERGSEEPAFSSIRAGPLDVLVAPSSWKSGG